MPSFIFYIIAAIPATLIPMLLVFVYVNNKYEIINKKFTSKFNIDFDSLLIISVSSFFAPLLIAGLLHVIAYCSFGVSDTETWSGRVMGAYHNTRWQEYYEEAVYRTEYYTTTESYTDSDGKSRTRTVTKSREVFDHWEPETRWHDDSYSYDDTLNGDCSCELSRYSDIKNKFGEEVKVKGTRVTSEHNSRMIGGDPYDRKVINKNNYIYPVTKGVSFDNTIKSCKSLFSYVDVPENIKVPGYPQNNNKFLSDRVIGNCGITTRELDVLNTKLGPIYKVNIIVANLDSDSMSSQYLESKFVGGKKNDLVITFGGTSDKVTWCRVFGWSDSYLVKRNIETIVMNNGMNSSTIDKIETEIKSGYKIVDWKKFDYLRQTSIHYSWFIIEIVLLVIGIVVLTFFLISNFKTQQRYDYMRNMYKF